MWLKDTVLQLQDQAKQVVALQQKVKHSKLRTQIRG